MSDQEKDILKKQLQEVMFDLKTALAFREKGFKDETIKRIMKKVEVMWSGSPAPLTLEEEKRHSFANGSTETISAIKPVFDKMLAALKAVSSNEHVDLGDLVYYVKDRELKGWEGPAVTQWSKTVELVKEAIKEAEELGL